MGILETIMKLTPFYKSFKLYKQSQTEKNEHKLEVKYHPLRVTFYKNFIQPNDLVFDVGANVGNRVAAFLECKAKVIAVEPQPSCIAILHEKFNNDIIIEAVGLGESIGELEMSIASDSTVSSFSNDYILKTKSRFKYSKWEQTIKVPVTTMDKLIEKHGTPAFCKIDVEGFELEVLKGLHSKIPILSIEYCVPEIQDQLVECLSYLNGIDPNSSYNYSIGESMDWALNEWLNYRDFLNHVKSNTFIKTSFGDIYVKSS